MIDFQTINSRANDILTKKAYEVNLVNPGQSAVVKFDNNLALIANPNGVICHCSTYKFQQICEHVLVAATLYYGAYGINLLEGVIDIRRQNLDSGEKAEHYEGRADFLRNLALYSNYDTPLPETDDDEERCYLEVELFWQTVGWYSDRRTLLTARFRVYVPKMKRSYVVKASNLMDSFEYEDVPFKAGNKTLLEADEDHFDSISLSVIQLLVNHRREHDKGKQLASYSGNYRDYYIGIGKEIIFLKAFLKLKLIRYTDPLDKDITYDSINLQDYSPQQSPFTIDLDMRDDQYVIGIKARPTDCLLLNHSPFLLKASEFYHLNQTQHNVLASLFDYLDDVDKSVKNYFYYPKSSLHLLQAALKSLEMVASVNYKIDLLPRSFTPSFEFSLTPSEMVKLQVTYQFEDGQSVKTDKELTSLPYACDPVLDQRIKGLQTKTGFKESLVGLGNFKSPLDLYRFFTESLPKYRDLGEVTISPELEDKFVLESPELEIEQMGGYLEVNFDFSSIEADEVDDALLALINQDDFYTSKSGQIILFDDETKKVSESLQLLRDKKIQDGKINLNSLDSLRVSQLFEGQDKISFGQTLQQLTQDITHPESFAIAQPPVKADLRPYQLTGIKWLSALAKYGFGGILADDMGLGKTIQAIAFLANHLTEGKKALVIAPAGLVFNWQDELKKFAPNLDFALAYGTKAERRKILSQDHQVIVTSYATFRLDEDLYQGHYFDYLFLDEAQHLKNSQTKITKVLREFEVGTTFALSGTPIENKLLEIWSIFQIVLPGLLPSKKAFNSYSPELVAHYVAPFILRRQKSEVLKDLPELTETIYRNELTKKQKTIYLAQLKQMQEVVSKATDADIKRNKIEILAGLTRLRQICDSPQLFLEDFTEQTGKMQSLLELAERAKENGNRVLIFSQFTSMIDLIQAEFDKLGYAYFTLTGATPSAERQRMSKAFNQGEKDFFLISLKAGGTGLNLTGADTVILVDLWWNPAVEEQAVGRAHRMGQKNPVDVYRLVTDGTIEDKILELQDSKRNLVNTVLEGSQTSSSLTVEEIKEILGL